MLQDHFIGRIIRDYLINELIGAGGVGWVYQAQHISIGKKIAIKILRPEYAQNLSLMTRFFREARVVNEIQHENIIDIFGFYTSPEEEFFILMELLQGKTLSRAISQNGPLSLRWIGHIGLQLCAALSAAHKKGVVHRDIKSDNIFLVSRAGQKNFVKVLDFGLARFISGEIGSFTPTGTLLGTPSCMSPEQISGDAVDTRTDIYALGVILYQMTTGILPFIGTTKEVLRKHLIAPVPSPRLHRPETDASLEALILRCLAKDRKARFSTIDELAIDLAKACGLELDAYVKIEEPHQEQHDTLEEGADTLENKEQETGKER